METKCYALEQCEVHSDAGGVGYKMTCPNCNTTIVFADGQWWDNDCDCGTWELPPQIAVLERHDED